jgi:hypothetical protein
VRCKGFEPVTGFQTPPARDISYVCGLKGMGRKIEDKFGFKLRNLIKISTYNIISVEFKASPTTKKQEYKIARRPLKNWIAAV